MRAALLLAGLTCFCVILLAAPARLPADEYQVKAAYLINFARFVEWPPTAISRGPITIGVVGSDPFGNALDRVVADRTAKGRPVSIRRFRSVHDLESCHILFISASEASRLQPILERVRRTPVLTVSDSAGFLKKGGGIAFLTADQRVTFEVNLKAIAEADLTVSAQLLQVARAVEGGQK